MSEGDAQFVALADGVMRDALVLAHDLAVLVHKIPGLKMRLPTRSSRNFLYPASGDKTNVLALRFLGGVKLVFARQIADFTFGEAS